MGIVYAIANQKGGVGKTTTAAALAMGLTKRGYKVLAVDLDAQRNLSRAYGIIEEPAGNAAALLMTNAPIDTLISSTGIGDIIASTRNLNNDTSKLATLPGADFRLQKALLPVKGKYDYIIIDTPPALSKLTINALAAADQVIVPAQADIFSLMGMEDLTDTIQQVKTYCNNTLVVAGVLLTRFNARSIISKDLAKAADELAGDLNSKVMAARIRESVTAKEFIAAGQNLFDYAPKAKLTQDYSLFIDELLGGGNNG